MRFTVLFFSAILASNIYADAPFEVLGDDDGVIVEQNDAIVDRIDAIEVRLKALENQRVDIKKLQLDLSELAAKSKNKVTVAPTKEKAVDSNVNIYHQALSSMQSKNYALAKDLFLQYLEFGQGDYVNDSYYYLGEMAFLLDDLGESEKYFMQLIKNTSDFNNLANTYLKLAIINERNNIKDKAQEFLQKLVKSYPNTSEAHIAKIKLKRHY